MTGWAIATHCFPHPSPDSFGAFVAAGLGATPAMWHKGRPLFRPRIEGLMPRHSTRRLIFLASFLVLFALGFAGSAAADPFGDWLSALRKQAAAEGVSKPTL